MSFYRPLLLRCEEPAYLKRNLSPEGDVGVDNDASGGVLLTVCYKTASFAGFFFMQFIRVINKVLIYILTDFVYS